MSQATSSQSIWWGQFQLENNQTVNWVIGPLKLAVKRLVSEWLIAYERTEQFDPEMTGWSLDQAAPDINELNYQTMERYVFDQASDTLQIVPALPDRPLITRPITPLYVPANGSSTVYVSSPLWLRLEINEPPIELQDLPVFRPPDTWFGPSTMEGQLCYASRTFARLNLENVPISPMRAITRVVINNQDSTKLLVEKLNLPVPYLALFEGGDGRLWTPTVTMVPTRDAGMATIEVDTAPPKQVQETKVLSSPRQQSEKSMVIRAFGALFG